MVRGNRYIQEDVIVKAETQVWMVFVKNLKRGGFLSYHSKVVGNFFVNNIYRCRLGVVVVIVYQELNPLFGCDS